MIREQTTRAAASTIRAARSSLIGCGLHGGGKAMRVAAVHAICAWLQISTGKHARETVCRQRTQEPADDVTGNATTLASWRR